ncbi:PD-(D/E)XK nuclease family protein [Mariniblastus sp.]|nr:PD-(D/E)XK nuclease family protein [Mariniblastus sp.]
MVSPEANGWHRLNSFDRGLLLRWLGKVELKNDGADGNHGNRRQLFDLEMPFESLDASGSIPNITRGVIDLCFEEPDGWVIVDYKTDDISESELQAATDYYSPQLTAYSKFWESTTGLKVAEAGIYFTKLSIYQPVESE